MKVTKIQLVVSQVLSPVKGARAAATLQVSDSAIVAVAGVTVTVSFSQSSSFSAFGGVGTVLNPSSISGVTNTSGQVQLLSPVVPSSMSGSFTVTVLGLSKAGYSYDAAGSMKSQNQVYLGFM